MKAGTKKVEAGTRQEQAISAIRDFESKQVDWDHNDLAKALSISVQHARNVMQALTFQGQLHHAVATVRKRRLVINTEFLTQLSA